MKIRTILGVLFFLLVVKSSVIGQHKSYKDAYQTYNAGEYFEAIDLLKEAYDNIVDKKDKTKIIFDLAECYRITNQPKKAALWYSKAIKKNYEDPIVYLHYARALKMKGNYEDARVQFKAYKDLVPSDGRGDEGITSCNKALEWQEYPNGYTVEELRFVNTKLNDYSPTYGREDFRVLYFTSTREETTGKQEHGATGQGFADIFETTLDRKGAWSTPVPLSEEISSEHEEGTAILNADFTRMYFTRCQVRDNKSMGCAIYMSSLSGGEWGKPESLDIANDSLVVAHPAISADELTLYFVSDMEGSLEGLDGKPSKDIWMVTRASTSDDFGEPINVGEPINTLDDEAFPFMHNDGTLYFSSTGHGGMGGLDIFKANKDDAGKWQIENMRYPINSSSDDFGICFEHSREAGFFTSSRKGRSDDIYSFVLPPLKFSIVGVVKSEKTNEPLAGANVKSIGSDGITLDATTGDDGTFKFMLKPNTDYVFLAKKEGFLNGKERETTKGQEKSVDFSTEIYLSPIAEPIQIENIFFDFGSAELRPESMVSLDKLVETLNDNPNITIELSSHTDARGDYEYNMGLSQERAQSVVNYLISKDIAADRLVAKGYGESKPKEAIISDHEAYPFIPVGQALTETYINTIEDEDLQEVAHFLNRRTEFRVLTTNYEAK